MLAIMAMPFVVFGGMHAARRMSAWVKQTSLPRIPKLVLPKLPVLATAAAAVFVGVLVVKGWSIAKPCHQSASLDQPSAQVLLACR
jgi:hypothetical protein